MHAYSCYVMYYVISYKLSIHSIIMQTVVIGKINVLVEFSHAIVTMHTKVYKLTSGVP